MGANQAVYRPGAPAGIVDHPVWREALDRVHAALARQPTVIAVLGPAGTGKSCLLRAVGDELRSAGRDVTLLAHGDVDARPGDAPGAERASGVVLPEVVLVDEADRLGPDALRALAESGSAVVVAALPGFAERLHGVPGATVVALRPLRPDEAAAFVQEKLVRAGTPGRLTGDALAQVVASGMGIPRLLCAVLSAAEFVASQENAPAITAEHVREAVLLRGEIEPEVDVGPELEPDAKTEAGSGAQAAAEPLPPAPPAAEQAVEPATPELAAEPAGRRAESADVPPARRRTGVRVAVLACVAAGIALFAAYAARQIPGRRLGLAPVISTPRTVASAAPPPAVSLSSAQPTVTTEIPPAEVAAPARPTPVPAAEAVRVPASTVADLPRGVTPHVVLSYRQGDAAAESRADQAARALRAAGIAANDPVPVLERVTVPGITYFFAEDQAGAADVGRALGGAFGEARAVTLRQDEPLPRPGTIELQVASESAEAAKRVP